MALRDLRLRLTSTFAITSYQPFSLQDFLVLVERTFGDATRLDQILVEILRTVLDQRQNAIFCSQFAHAIQEEGMNQIVQVEVWQELSSFQL